MNHKAAADDGRWSCHCARIYQQDLYGAQDVQWSSEGGSQVETKTHRSSKFWSQWPGDHVVRAASCKETKFTVMLTIFVKKKDDGDKIILKMLPWLDHMSQTRFHDHVYVWHVCPS